MYWCKLIFYNTEGFGFKIFAQKFAFRQNLYAYFKYDNNFSKFLNIGNKSEGFWHEILYLDIFEDVDFKFGISFF